MISPAQFIINSEAHAEDFTAMSRAAQLLACANLQAKHPELILDIEPTIESGWAHWLQPTQEDEPCR